MFGSSIVSSPSASTVSWHSWHCTPKTPSKSQRGSSSQSLFFLLTHLALLAATPSAAAVEPQQKADCYNRETGHADRGMFSRHTDGHQEVEWRLVRQLPALQQQVFRFRHALEAATLLLRLKDRRKVLASRFPGIAEGLFIQRH